MDIAIIDTASLGDQSYLISADDVAAVIDPQRDIDRVLRIAANRTVQITHVLETHIHNDYVTGGLELARRTGAQYVIPAGENVSYEARAVEDGDVIDVGLFALRVIATPGHTRHHASYALIESGAAIAVFTGGSLLHGNTGRTDLEGDDHTLHLSHAQYRSVQRLARELPATADVYPTHGFGSFCSATSASSDSSTIGQQRKTNPVLTQDEQSFVDGLLAELSVYPAYYTHMGGINRGGPEPVDLSLPKAVDSDELLRRIDSGEWIVDLRHRTAFASGHVRGTIGFELSESFVTYLGWLYSWGTPLTLIGDSDAQIIEARRELVRIGIDTITGAASDRVENLADGAGLRSYRVADFARLSAVVEHDGVVVLDVRQHDEYRNGHIGGAVNIPVQELTKRADELPDGEIWVHCASGYRASVAASLLDRRGRTVVLVDDNFDNAKDI